MANLPETRFSLIASLGDPANRRAWDEFLSIYSAAVLRYCQSRGLLLDDATDVVQDVCIATHQAAATWTNSGRSGSFRTWLFETARRMCLSSIRRRSRDRTVSLLSSDLDDASVSSSELACDALAIHKPEETEHFERLDWQRWAFCWAAGQVQANSQSHTWQAFWRTAVEGQSPEQVAVDLSLSVGAVYAAKCRVLAKIRAVVSELSQGEYRVNDPLC
jgi:RNA polymerase sigma factor (sigma-70 family)